MLLKLKTLEGLKALPPVEAKYQDKLVPVAVKISD